MPKEMFKVGCFLPNELEIIIPVEKIRDYSLNMNRPDGAPKAYLIANLLGYRKADYQTFIFFIESQVKAHPIKEVREDKWGIKLRIDIPFESKLGKGAQEVLTAWIIRSDNQSQAQLTSAYVKGV